MEKMIEDFFCNTFPFSIINRWNGEKEKAVKLETFSGERSADVRKKSADHAYPHSTKAVGHFIAAGFFAD